MVGNLAVTFFWFQQKQKQGKIGKGIHAIAVACIPTSQKWEVNFIGFFRNLEFVS